MGEGEAVTPEEDTDFDLWESEIEFLNWALGPVKDDDPSTTLSDMVGVAIVWLVILGVFGALGVTTAVLIYGAVT